MKLKFVGMICPTCNLPCSYVGPMRRYDTWIGYVRECWCNNCCESFETRTWLMLFDDRRAFRTILPGGVFFLLSAGDKQPLVDLDEIPF